MLFAQQSLQPVTMPGAGTGYRISYPVGYPRNELPDNGSPNCHGGAMKGGSQLVPN